jgi:hypothetical protein
MRKFLLISLVFFIAGCTQVKQLQHLDELMTLQDVSKNGDEEVKFVEAQDKNFDRLLEVVKSDKLKNFPDKKSILSTFGQPILVSPMTSGGEEWLYRYAIKYFNTDKIYLYFDDKGNLMRAEHVVPQSPTVASNPPIQ